jgi:hypothetical protein
MFLSQSLVASIWRLVFPRPRRTLLMSASMSRRGLCPAADHGTCEANDTLTSADSPQTFGSTTLYRRGRTDGARQPFFHLPTPRRDLRHFAHHRAIHVADDPSVCADELCDVSKDLDGICSSPLWIGVWEVLAEIAQTGSSQQGVGNGVCHCVGITVSLQTCDTFENTPAEHHSARRIIARAMNVESLSHSNIHEEVRG